MSEGGWNQPPGGPPQQQPGGYPQQPGGYPQQQPGGYGQAPPGGGPPGGTPGGGGGAPPAGPTGGAPRHKSPQKKGFFAGLFDFSFETFVTLKVVKILYALFLLALVFGLLGGFGFAVWQMINGELIVGAIYFVMTPIAILIYLVLGRVYFELIVVMFKIAEDMDEVAKNTRP